MSQIAVTIKIDADVKAHAQKLASRLGLSLSAIVENQLKEVIRERRVVFEDDLVPNDKTARQLEMIENDVKAGRNLSGPFASFEELDRHLNTLGRAD